MTLDEAIKHCEEKAKELRAEAEQLRDIGEVISSPKQPYNIPVKNCRDCAKEHEQLAEWLEELKEIREVVNEFTSTHRKPYVDRSVRVEMISEFATILNIVGANENEVKEKKNDNKV